MSKKPETLESKLRKQIKVLKQEIGLRDALAIDKYPDPTPLDLKTALAESSQKTRFGRPFVEAWIVRRHDGPAQDIVTAERDGVSVYGNKLDALIAWRNLVARDTAVRLAALDQQIDEAAKNEIGIIAVPATESETYSVHTTETEA